MTAFTKARVSREVEELIVRFAKENSGWGYDRIVGALANLGHCVSDQTVGNILERFGLGPAPKRSQTIRWKDFIASHMSVMAGMDFFTVEVLTWRGLATYYVLFLIRLGNRRVSIAGITDHPEAMAMEQMARNATLEELGCLHPCRYLLHDRDTKFCKSFREVLKAGGVKPMKLPARSPEFERIRREMGAIDKRGMLVEVDSVRRVFPEESGNGVRRALPSGEKPSR